MAIENPYAGIHPEHSDWESMADHKVFVPTDDDHALIEDHFWNTYPTESEKQSG